MVKEDTNLRGNARFEGFFIDLLKSISTQMGFHYKIELVPDNMDRVFNPSLIEAATKTTIFATISMTNKRIWPIITQGIIK